MPSVKTMGDVVNVIREETKRSSTSRRDIFTPMMMTIALRFIPTLLEETDRIMKAQMSRGADFSSGNIMKRAKNMLPILIPLFISSFRRADELALAMEARCYRGGEGRTRMHQLVFGKGDMVTAAVMLALFAVLAFLKWRMAA